MINYNSVIVSEGGMSVVEREDKVPLCWCRREGCQWLEENYVPPLLVLEGGMSVVERDD